ncbi:MAG TPA: NADH-quinone oxidoreductase subunit NuoG [Acidimicrobiia bacterium]|nr:NADH-quinone oxidoreductase subunit NuoG [Acidimicrobiia bacterium]
MSLTREGIRPSISPEMVKVTVDGQEFEAPKGQMLIQAAQDHGTYIPRFCWHSRMRPVGMCRMCLVEMETPRGKVLITACTNPVADGMVIDTRSDVAKKAQEGVLEFLLINHPLDCPVCDRGGECPLQDHTIAYGPGESRFVEEKRHFEKPIKISDLVYLDRERCILCARCTRFSDEVSGDPLIEFLDRGNYTQINTFPDQPFSSYFSGNTVQICPVGALTSKAYRFRARPWDLVSIESTCPHCTTGDRMSVQASQNVVLRFLGVDAEATNWGWLSDKCRFGFEFIGSPDRLTTPLIRQEDGSFQEATWSEAMEVVASRFTEIREAGKGLAVLGGARGTNEDAYALGKFARVVLSTNDIDCQLDDGLDPQFLAATADRALISDLDTAKTILVWGPDLKEEHPTLYLRVRHAVQEKGARLILVHPRRNGLDDRATHKLTYRPGSGAALLTRLQSDEGEVGAALAEGPLVALVGRTGYGEDGRLSEAVAAHVRTLGGKILPLARRSNVYGALDMGLAPSLVPGRAQADKAGKGAVQILEGLADGSLIGLLLVGADPVRDVPNGELARQALEKARFVVALDQFLTDSSRLAHVVLPVEGFAEKEGTVTNAEGRVQKVNRVVPGPGQSRADWSILDDLSDRMGRPINLVSAEAIAKEIATEAPAYIGITWDLLDSQKDGVIVPLPEATQPLVYLPADAPGKSPSAELVLHYARTMFDDGVLMRHGPSIEHLAPGATVYLNFDDARRLGLADGEQADVRTSQGSARLPVQIDPDLAHGVVYVPFNQPGTPSLGSDPVVTVTKADSGSANPGL